MIGYLSIDVILALLILITNRSVEATVRIRMHLKCKR